MKTLPRFSVLSANFPAKSTMDTKALLDAIGGKVRKNLDDSVNTCALRISWCLNKSGQRIERTPGIRVYEGAVEKPNPARARQVPPDLYLVSADEMRDYMTAHYGAGSLIYDATKSPASITLGGRKVVQGLIVFDWMGRTKDFGASGHVDLFYVLDQGAAASPQFVPACVGACYWQDTKKPMKAFLWEAAP